jgi:RNA polymerase sigma-70 factor (ECF subfamily)
MRKRVPAAISCLDDPEGSLKALGVSAGWGTEDPERMAARAQDRAFLARAFGRLPEAYREILTLRDLEGIPGETVAEMLGLALPAMKSRLHRARLALAACLREDGYHA